MRRTKKPPAPAPATWEPTDPYRAAVEANIAALRRQARKHDRLQLALIETQIACRQRRPERARAAA